ncbi:dihydrolipoamide acetyltransferase family protein [Neobacillus mesonae]|uniref:dihydrolipoamide acetyltransferase family protein n=1 Tax=Neobacillus mesonae TaxID=1193713 RepID=UPI00203BE48E|nr:dihydrolipoamide acetyltransferase family protein [Neobacillus mesonae]MCM3567505.1 2-oxo acid dehydrogenase subunit E2 [Neobacillus mesonae]
MAVIIEMPKLSLTMQEGTVLHWMKEVGESVKKGEAIVEVSSDKEVCELDSPEDGVLLNIVTSEGESVACHSVLAYIGMPGENTGNGNHSQEAAAALQTFAEAKVERKAVNQPENQAAKIKISPVARKMAVEANLDLQAIAGTGPNGRITKEDVEKVIQEKAAAASVTVTVKPAEPETKQEQTSAASSKKTPLIGMRKVIAARMQQSLQQSAQLTHHVKADITELLSLKKQTAEHVQNRLHGKLTVTDFIARAVVLSLIEHEQMNSALMEDEIHVYHNIHLGIAADVENGLVVPVIHQAESKSLLELSHSIKELGQLAKSKKLTSEQMKGSTFTISNLGGYGVEYFTPILNPPETGILGVGTAQDTPIFVGEAIQKRTLLPLSLTFNHQVVDGAPAAEFLRTVKNYLEEPIHLLL